LTLSLKASELQEMFGGILDDVDDWGYLEVLYNYTHDLKPDLVLETGTYTARSAVIILAAMRENGKGSLISIDNHSWHPEANIVAHERIEQLDFTNAVLVDADCLNPPQSILESHFDFIFLDTVHTRKQVAKELEIYSPLTDRVFIHDTLLWKGQDGCLAVEEFLRTHANWSLYDHDTKWGLWLIERH
jgi:cephalosporin hydroxylase